MAKSKKARAAKYDEKLAISGTFKELIPKQERELEEIAKLADIYRKWTTDKVLAVRNGSPFSHTPKKYRIAIKAPVPTGI
jgi:hypothetical protein